ncbi:MAG: hypothetical protein ACR2GI_02700 [Thermomicrobiales bacterium]
MATVIGESETAARLLSAAAAEANDIAYALPEGVYYIRMEDAARLRLGTEAYQAAWDFGPRSTTC